MVNGYRSRLICQSLFIDIEHSTDSLSSSKPACGLQCTSNLFEKLRSDIVVRKKRGYIYVIESTVPCEASCKTARRRKQEKYRDLRSQLLVPCDKFKVITLEQQRQGRHG